ncbi:MAG: ABC transporter ATP-binding protein [Rectinemataceae bacterium]
MSDYFEHDEITKGYDSRIASRILGYVKPYRLLTVLALIALIVSTAGELFSPIIIRKSIDEALIVSWFGFDQAVAGEEAMQATLKITPEDPLVAGKVYLRASRLSGLSGAERRDLEARGLFSPQEMYLVEIDASDAPQTEALAAHPELFTVDGSRAVMRLADLKALPGEAASALRKNDRSRIASNVILLLGILVTVLVSTFLMTYLTNLIGLKVMKDLRMQLFAHVSSRSLSFLSKQPVGRLVTRMTSDVETINQFFTDVLIAFTKDFSIMAGSLAVLFALDARLALSVLATVPFVLIVANVARKKARDAFRNQRQWTSKVNAYIAERLSGINVVKLFGREKASNKEFEAHDRQLMKANLGEMYVFATFRPVVDFLATLTNGIALVVGAVLFLNHSVSLGTLIAFVNLIGMFYSPIKDMAEKYTLLQSAMAGGERIFTLLDAKDTIPDEATRPMPATVRGHIEFEHVWFAYKDEEWVLRDISFRIDPGQMVAIVGYTGAGKTTIANLVTRFWDVQKGEIRVDGIPVRDMPLGGLRKAIQPVPQDVFLFSGSIADNLRMGTEVTEERMKIAAGAVHADEFIDLLPQGYETQLSEGATNLSQGQRQILSFARVLAHDPAVIILDEATSSVDTETERQIQRGLDGLLAGRTSLVIAHRLSTIRHADRILVLAQGRVAESGTHDELIAKQGLYWNLYKLQYGGEV